MRLFNRKSHIAVIGYGSWATALVNILTENGSSVFWHIRNLDILEAVKNEGHNPRYLSEIALDTKRIELSSDINEVVDASNIILLAAPSAYVKAFLEPLKVSLSDKFIISATKGLIPGDCVSISEFLANGYGVDRKNLCVISGPTHAEEVARGMLSFICAAGQDRSKCAVVNDLFKTQNLIVDYSSDVFGVEYSAVMKNIFGVASGLASGLGYGDNFLAVLVSQCVREMKIFLDTLYPESRDYSRKEYMGDLLVTSYSSYSRNRRLGNLIGRGCTVRSALNEMTMIAEGYFSTASIKQICDRNNLKLPVVDMVYSILYQNANPRRAMKALSSIL